MGIRHTRSIGTKDIPQVPRLSAPGSFDPKPQAAPHLFPRVSESVLDISFYTQSQSPDILDISLCDAISRYLASQGTVPIHDPGHPHALVVRVFGRTLDFFQLTG